MQHVIATGSSVELKILAKEKYSKDCLLINTGEVYTISCDNKQRWNDSWFPSGPDGFSNILTTLFGIRVKGVKCFCLCGTYNEQDDTAFSVGSYKEVTINHTGTLSFFANDHSMFYWNNSGLVKVSITRVL